MADLKFEMFDWCNGDKNVRGDEIIDARPWQVEVTAKSKYQQDGTLDSFELVATCPDGTKRQIWIEVSGGALVAHCYDDDHDEPLNVSICADRILTDNDREDGEGIDHANS